MTKEAKARILIFDFLQGSGWRFFYNETSPADIALDVQVKLKKKTLGCLGDDIEKTSRDYVDYLLLDKRGFPKSTNSRFDSDEYSHCACFGVPL